MKQTKADQNTRYAVRHADGAWYGVAQYKTLNLTDARLYGKLSTARSQITSLAVPANIVVFELVERETLDDTDRRTAAQRRALERDAKAAKRKALKLLEDAQEQVERANATLTRIRNA